MNMDTSEIKAGDFIIIGFGNGTQGIKVIGTTAKRLEIIRCQQYLSDSPFWTGTVSKISRTDKRIQAPWTVPASIAAAAPTQEAIDEEKARGKHQAACSKLIGKVVNPMNKAHWAMVHARHDSGKVWRDMNEDERAAWRKEEQDSYDAMRDAREAIVAEYAAKHGRNEGGRVIEG